jgi:hypothetical protein
MALMALMALIGARLPVKTESLHLEGGGWENDFLEVKRR